jgi:peroxiredoxin family protein
MHSIGHINYIAGIITILSTAIAFGTDFFFAFVGKKALLKSDEASMVNVVGNMHEIADKRMPIIGGTAILGTVYLIVFKGLGTPDLTIFLIALVALLVHLMLYLLVAKPVNEKMKEAVKYGRILMNARALQKQWDSVIVFRSMALLIAIVFTLFGLSNR